jgi:predicted metalloprotease with PDZ domain
MCLCCCACAPWRPHDLPPAAARAASPALSALDYEVRIDAGLSRLSTRVCFQGAAPAELVYGAATAAEFLREPHVLAASGAAAAALRIVAGRIQLAGVAADSCITYDIDVRAALEHDSLMLAYPGEASLLFGTELFLWRPAQRARALHTSLHFVLPEGMRVSAPWPEQAQRFLLDESAFAFTGHVVIGRFSELRLPVAGAQLRVAVLDGFPSATRALFEPWLRMAAAAVSQPAGSFPVADAQVIVVPTSPSPFPIHFGHTGRSGGASIVLFLPTDADEASLRSDWVAIHEFSHLLHPFIQRSDAWLSEGLATYLQEVLRARAGLLTPALAWQRLYEGAALGKQTDNCLAHESQIMAHAHNYQRVYWAGAAIALMCDVELRRRSAGKITLDSVLAELLHRHAQVIRPVAASDLLRALDEIAGMNVFEQIAQRYLAEGEHFPELSALYRELGLSDQPGVVRGDAPLAAIRDAIMASHSLALGFPRAPGM